jgi:hypothetical protein
MFIFFAIFGLIVLITGIVLKMKSKKKVWNILIGLGIMGVIISLILFICTILLVYGQDDNIPSSSIDSIDIDIYVCDYMPW